MTIEKEKQIKELSEKLEQTSPLELLRVCSDNWLDDDYEEIAEAVFEGVVDEMAEMGFYVLWDKKLDIPFLFPADEQFLRTPNNYWINSMENYRTAILVYTNEKVMKNSPVYQHFFTMVSPKFISSDMLQNEQKGLLEKFYTMGSDYLMVNITDQEDMFERSGSIPSVFTCLDEEKVQEFGENRVIGACISYVQGNRICDHESVRVNPYFGELCKALTRPYQCLWRCMQTDGMQEMDGYLHVLRLYRRPLSEIDTTHDLMDWQKISTEDALSILDKASIIIEPETLHIVLPKKMNECICI